MQWQNNIHILSVIPAEPRLHVIDCCSISGRERQAIMRCLARPVVGTNCRKGEELESTDIVRSTL